MEQEPGSGFLLKQLSGQWFSSKARDTSGKPGLGEVNDRLGLGPLEFGVPVGRARGKLEEVIGYTGEKLRAFF